MLLYLYHVYTELFNLEDYFSLKNGHDHPDFLNEILLINFEIVSFFKILTNKTTQARHSWTIYLVLKTEKEHR